MPWLWEAKKDVISCEKLRGAANRHIFDPRMSEWGTHAGIEDNTRKGEQTRELKHLSTRRKRKQSDFSSGERTGAKPVGNGVVGLWDRPKVNI